MSFLLFFIVTFFGFPKHAHANDILLSEDFEDGSSQDGNPVMWYEEAVAPGGWTVESGVYIGATHRDGGKTQYTFAGDTTWSNYVFEVSMLGIEGVDRHIRFRFNRFTKQGYALKYMDAKYGFGTQQPAWMELFKSGQSLIKLPVKSQFGEWNRIKVELLDNLIVVSLNDTEYIRYLDENNPILEGQIGLMVQPAGFWDPTFDGWTKTGYDDILVRRIETTTSIPNFKQYDQLWGDLEYDDAQKWSSIPTISEWGCALTSASMILNYFGYDIDPAELNSWLLTEPDGYLGDGYVNWLAISRYTFLNQADELPVLEFSAHEYSPLYLESLLNSNIPNILKMPGHFVVATQSQAGDILINDPASELNFLQELEESIGRKVNKIYTYTPSNTDLSYLVFISHPTVQLSSEKANFIILTEEAFIPRTNGSTEQAPILINALPKPSETNYSIKVSGNSVYEIGAYLYDAQGNVKIFNIGGIVSEDTPELLEVNLISPRAAKFVDIKTLQVDIREARNYSLVNKKIAFLIRRRLLLIKMLLKRNRVSKARKLLFKLSSEIQKLPDKGIDPKFRKIFHQDLLQLYDTLE